MLYWYHVAVMISDGSTILIVQPYSKGAVQKLSSGEVVNCNQQRSPLPFEANREATVAVWPTQDKSPIRTGLVLPGDI